MVKYFSIFITATILFACGGTQKNNTSFSLSGKLEHPNGEWLFLENMSRDGVKVIDSTQVNESGDFNFEHAKPQVGFYRLRITEQNFVMLILDSTQKVTITGDAANIGSTAVVKGSKDTEVFNQVNEYAKSVQLGQDSLSRLLQAFANANKNNEKLIRAYNDSVVEQSLKMVRDYEGKITKLVRGDLSLFANIAIVSQLRPNDFNLLRDSVANALAVKYPESTDVKDFKKSIAAILNLEVGRTAPDFTLATADGKPVALSSFKGKYVMIDFWASWCKPCRAEFPNLKKTYAKYKSKGFEIFGVSIDEKEQDWLGALKSEQPSWLQVRDNAGQQNSVAALYAVSYIPQTYLLDKDGKIIAKELRGAELEKKLAEILK